MSDAVLRVIEVRERATGERPLFVLLEPDDATTRLELYMKREDKWRFQVGEKYDLYLSRIWDEKPTEPAADTPNNDGDGTLPY